MIQIDVSVAAGLENYRIFIEVLIDAAMV